MLSFSSLFSSLTRGGFALAVIGLHIRRGDKVARTIAGVTPHGETANAHSQLQLRIRITKLNFNMCARSGDRAGRQAHVASS